MGTTNKKECPKCKSLNIYDTRIRMGGAVAALPGREIPEPRNPLYECKDCGEQFFIEESK